MKLFKKVMSLIIASIMMLQVAAFAAPAPADVNGTFYEDAAKLLSALEIMVGDGNGFNGEKNITRAEFTKIMVAAAGNADIVAGYKAKGVFSDVPTTQWYAPYVEFGKDMGAINGMGDGIFAPNDNVTGEQAVKMMICVIGYGLPAAEIGYPEGYVSVARDLGVLKGIANVDLTKPMTRGQAAVLCANIMKVDVMKKIASGDKEQWAAQKGVNLLSSKFSAYELEGVVSANASTAIWETSNLDAGEVEITVGGVKKLFLAGDTDIDTKLGASVKFVYQYDDYEEESTVLCYTASEKDNVAVTVDFEQFDMTGDELTYNAEKREFSYWPTEDAKKAETIAVESMPAIIYNGAAISNPENTAKTVKEFLEDNLDYVGEVTFLDANGVDGAETLIVTAYENYVIGYIDAENYIIVDEMDSNKKIQIDLDDENVAATFVDKNGKELSFKALQEGDVLSVAKSDADTGKRVFRVVACDDMISGVVKVMGLNENGKFAVELDNGKTYIFSQTMLEAYREGDLRLGRSVGLKLDAFGLVAALDTPEAGNAVGKFGFLIDYKESQSTTGSYQAKIFTAEGQFAILPLASKVTIDGAKCKGDSAIYTALETALNAAPTYVADTRVAPMLYELDATGAIDYIDTPYFNEEEEDVNALGAIKGGSSGIIPRTYSNYYKGFDNMIPFNAGAKILAIPSDGDFENEKKVYFMKQADFSNDKNYDIQLFNTDRDSYEYTFAICVVESAGSGKVAYHTGEDIPAQRKRPLFVVNKVTLTLVQDEYGEDIETLKVYGMAEGVSTNITIDPDYYAEGRYDMVGSENTLFNHVYFGVTFNEAGTARRYGSEGVNFETHKTRTPSATRQSSVLMPGDIFTYGTNNEGYVHYVRPMFLYEEKAFLSQNYYEGSRVLGAVDLAIPVEIDGTDARFAKISDTSDEFNEFMFEELYDAESGTISKSFDGSEITNTRTIAGVEQKYYDPDKLTVNDVRSIGSAKMMVVDMKAKNASQLVTTGSVTDIIDARNTISPATPCIIRNFNSNIVAIIVFKNL